MVAVGSGQRKETKPLAGPATPFHNVAREIGPGPAARCSRMTSSPAGHTHGHDLRSADPRSPAGALAPRRPRARVPGTTGRGAGSARRARGPSRRARAGSAAFRRGAAPRGSRGPPVRGARRPHRRAGRTALPPVAAAGLRASPRPVGPRRPRRGRGRAGGRGGGLSRCHRPRSRLCPNARPRPRVGRVDGRVGPRPRHRHRRAPGRDRRLAGARSRFSAPASTVSTPRRTPRSPTRWPETEPS